METKSQLLADAQHQSMADTEPGLEPGPYASSHVASSQIPNLSWPRAERVRSREKNCMWGPQITERRRKKGLRPAGPYSTDLLSHQEAKAPTFFQVVVFNLFPQ